MRRGAIVVLTALIAAVGIGVMETQAKKKKHVHDVNVFYVQDSTSIGAFDVESVLVFCPNGTAIAGVGASTPGIAYVNESSLDPASNSGTVFYVNDSSIPSTIGAQAACVGGTGKNHKPKRSVSKAKRDQALEAARAKEARLDALLNRSE